jgi:PEP-CTERM putative exosortase interaction domain
MEKGRKMKKVMMIAAAVAVAGMMQAASVNWSANAIREPGGVGTITDGTQLMISLVFTADVGTTTGWQTGSSVGSYTYGSLSALAPLATLTGAQLTVTATDPKQAGVSAGSGGPGQNLLSQSWAETNRGADNYASFYAVIFYNAAGSVTEANATHYAVTKIYNVNLMNIASTGANINMVGVFNQATWTAVPEPTAMALLALGAVAFGLRRRFRK